MSCHGMEELIAFQIPNIKQLPVMPGSSYYIILSEIFKVSLTSCNGISWFAGHTMFVDVSHVGKEKIAHLVTPSIKPETSTFCVTFWFFMFGNDVATLTVSQKVQGRILSTAACKGFYTCMANSGKLLSLVAYTLTIQSFHSPSI